MIRIGQAPYLECSSRGDKRFSAFYARINGKSIEERYQAAKVFEDGSTSLSIKDAKGRRAINQVYLDKHYEDLWRVYLDSNPDLYDVLREASGLSDIFGQKGHVCQALTLWKLREEVL